MTGLEFSVEKVLKSIPKCVKCEKHPCMFLVINNYKLSGCHKHMIMVSERLSKAGHLSQYLTHNVKVSYKGKEN